VRERLKAGDSNEQVLNFLTSRYGEFVLLKPSFTWHNALLWLAPLIMLGAAGLVLALRRKPSATSDTAPLSPDEERRVQEAINR
jgi:cytochrome c-type biogenesis protein CcmH